MSKRSIAGLSNIVKLMPNWPLVVWLIVAALFLGLVSGLDAPNLIQVFNMGWGRAIGEFALILLPSFVLAAVLTRKNIGEVSTVAVLASPVAGAGMICPDTAYAALSPISGRRRLSVAFGSYAGFKLLFPAGPLIVATGLGVSDTSWMVYCLVLFFPVWAIGLWWANYNNIVPIQPQPTNTYSGNHQGLFAALAPFAAMIVLLMLGEFIDLSSRPGLDFLTNPKGALLFAAAWALLSTPPHQRRECLDEAVRRTGSLLFVIGAASAFGAVLVLTIPIGEFFPKQSGLLGIISLFMLTALFKLAQGSSMATFAAVAPVAAPIVASSNLPPAAAVFAICLGSFVAILPNDSFYWLVSKDAFINVSESKRISILAGGATVQSLGGLLILLILFGTSLMA
jgi:GntP family gluconate:H+ symporter